MTSFVGKNSISNLSLILQKENAKNLLIFTGKKSYESIKPIVELELSKFNTTYYNDFSTNPKKDEIDVAIKELDNNFDIIIAIGGGSVIDFAKAYKYYTKSSKLVAIPTTCGTGSEATQFAVIYIDGIKHSLDEKSILPDYAIVDSRFVENNPKYLKACTAMDAFCQAIESFWAVKATDESRDFAKKAIKICKENIIDYVNSTESSVAENMAIASNLAGKAINISRTTAAHALSYKFTSEYGIPHGHAVALSIVGLFKLNNEINQDNIAGSVDINKISQVMLELNSIFDNKFIAYFENLFKEIELELDLEKLEVKDIDLIVESVNVDRLQNNPRKLSTKDLRKILS